MLECAAFGAATDREAIRASRKPIRGRAQRRTAPRAGLKLHWILVGRDDASANFLHRSSCICDRTGRRALTDPQPDRYRLQAKIPSFPSDRLAHANEQCCALELLNGQETQRVSH